MKKDAKKLEYDYADFGAEMLEGVLAGLLTFTSLTLVDIEQAMRYQPSKIF